MSLTADQMERREEDIHRHYPAAQAMPAGFDHAGIGDAAQCAARGVRLIARIQAVNDGDVLTSLRQALTMQARRRALAIALAVAENYGAATPLADLKRANLAGDLAAVRKTEFSELLTAAALISLHVFANALAYLLFSHLSEVSVEPGEVQEILTDNGQLGVARCFMGAGSGFGGACHR